MSDHLKHPDFHHGDYLKIPICDGKIVLGQIVYVIPPPIGVPIIAFYQPKNKVASEMLVGNFLEFSVNKEDFILIFCHAVVPSMIYGKHWLIVGSEPEKIEIKLLTRVLKYAKNKFAGLSVIDAQIALDCLDIHFSTARGLALPDKIRESGQRILLGNL